MAMVVRPRAPASGAAALDVARVLGPGGVPSPSVAMLPGLATGALGLLLGMRFFWP